MLLFVKLRDPSHRLLWPDGTARRWLNPSGEFVDGSNAYWLGALADGSLVEAAPPQPDPSPDPSPEPAPEPAPHSEPEV